MFDVPGISSTLVGATCLAIHADLDTGNLLCAECALLACATGGKWGSIHLCIQVYSIEAQRLDTMLLRHV